MFISGNNGSANMGRDGTLATTDIYDLTIRAEYDAADSTVASKAFKLAWCEITVAVGVGSEIGGRVSEDCGVKCRGRCLERGCFGSWPIGDGGFDIRAR